MFDERELARRNEIAHLRALAHSKEEIEKKAFLDNTEPVYPLSVIARKLMAISGIPSLAALVDILQSPEGLPMFKELIREFLPEHEAEIMGEYGDQRIPKFVRFFNERYFQLADIDYEELGLYDFVTELPVDLLGFGYESYHSFSDFREGYILMLSLVMSPYDDAMYSDDMGGRVPILSAVGKLVGEDILPMLPKAGWSTKELEEKLEDPLYEGVIAFSKWVNIETDSCQLNADLDGFQLEPWSTRLVEQLTEEAPVIIKHFDDCNRIAGWLEEDLPRNFRIILRLMLPDEHIEIVPKEQMPLAI